MSAARLPRPAVSLLLAVGALLAGPARPARCAPPVEGLEAFKQTLRPAAVSVVDLRRFQTPVKVQGGGTCYTFGLVGAIEAAYKRRCIKDPSLRLSEAYCARQLAPNGRDLDLAEYQFLNDMASQSSTRNPQASHEAMGAVCGWEGYLGNSGSTWATHDAVLAAARAIRLTEEADSPWPSGAMSQSFLADALGLQPSAGVNYKPSYCTPDPPVWDMNPRYDNFNYDPLNVPYDARYQARYGVTAVQAIPASDARRVASLEQYLANHYEVDIGFELSGLSCPPGSTLRGAARCSRESGVNDLGTGGHVMLLVGYDRRRRLFLFKNSWGDHFPYVWLPYSFIHDRAGDSFIVRGVRPARPGLVTHEQGYLGTWAVFDRERKYRGRIAIHRTRDMPDGFADYAHGRLRAPYVTEDARLRRITRLGTFFTRLGSRRKVYGQLNAGGKLRIFVKSASTGPGGDLRGTTYSGGDFWGTMVLSSADAARDGLNQTYVRDFSRRAAANWAGVWDLTLRGPATFISQATLTLSAQGNVPTIEGRYPFTGTYQELSMQDTVAGYVDRRGEHARFEFDLPPNGGALRHCVLELAHRRTDESGPRDQLVPGFSTLVCTNRVPYDATGAKRLAD